RTASVPLPAGGVRPEAEPSLRAHLLQRAQTGPGLALIALVVALAALAAWTVGGQVAEAVEGPDEEALARQAAIARAEWAAMRRQNPRPLAAEPVADTLGPGDAERTDDRYADYFVHDADSTGFSVLITAADFAPDLVVRRPDGETVAASNLLRTDQRAEIAGLEGPGRFEIVVTSVQPGDAGTYQLEVVPAGPIDSVYVDRSARLDTLGTGRLRAGHYERLYGVSTGVEAPVIVRVVSSAFVPQLHLFGPNGEVADEWRTLERSSQGDSLHGVLLRYVPGWEAPYRLVVTSETPGQTGPFALDVQSVPIRALRLGRAVRGTLGDESWLEDGRYVDTYRFRPPTDAPTVVTVRSDDVPPAVRLWTVRNKARVEIEEGLNEAGAAEVTLEPTLEGGLHYLEVMTGGEVEPGAPARGGRYTVSIEAGEPEVLPDSLVVTPLPGAGGPVPETRVFPTEVRRTGRSGGSTFEVGVTQVALSYPGGSRTRVQLSVTVRSVDYAGNWAPWRSFAQKAYVVDNAGRRYTASVAEARSPSGPRAEPGTARRGTVVFYAPGLLRPGRLVLVASVGQETVTLPIPVR
ncbi:MAG: hypothetical protein AAF845_06835, partial [Bacteroidota bacterium]